MSKIEIGKILHCAETVTGKNLTGTMLISETEMRADLYSYDDFFHIKAEKPVHLIAQSGHIVSLHSNVDGGLGHTSYLTREVHHQVVISNVAVVGGDAWTADDKIRHVSFTVDHTMALVRHKPKIELIANTRLPDEDAYKLFEGRAGSMVLSAGYSASWGGDSDGAKKIWPHYAIEFDEPKSILDYIRSLAEFTDFLSFCLGVALKPSAIKIDRITMEEILARIETQSYDGHHDVHYVWPESEFEPRDLWVGGSPVCAWEEDDLASLLACLLAWMERADRWRKAYRLMKNSFALRNVLSAERLINACSWLEEIPIAAALKPMEARVVDEIAAPAVAKALALGLSPELGERIKGAIGKIREESSAERFERLSADLRDYFGADILPDTVVTDLKRALHFRGRCAHGHFSPDSDQEFLSFARSMRAMEAFCFFLTALDLPISEDGRGRLRNHPVRRDYIMTQT